jgi:tetratricopeptide (TPR) repeat protein
MPRRDAITYLSKAAALLKETEVLADLNFKIGNVYIRAGSKKQAYPYYARSVELVPENAGARQNLIDVCKALYKNRVGLEQLNYLYDHQQINFPKRLLLAEFLIHSSQFEKARKIIAEAQYIHPFVVAETFDLEGRLSLLSGQFLQAILSYKNYLVVKPENSAALYTVAGLYAKTGNVPEAWRFLEKALQKGFRYSWVLQFDPSWKELRNTKKWNDLVNKFPMKKYASPVMQ